MISFLFVFILPIQVFWIVKSNIYFLTDLSAKFIGHPHNFISFDRSICKIVLEAFVKTYRLLLKTS